MTVFLPFLSVTVAVLLGPSVRMSSCVRVLLAEANGEPVPAVSFKNFQLGVTVPVVMTMNFTS